MSKLGKNGLQLYHNMAVAPLYDIAKEKGEIADSIPLVWEYGNYGGGHTPTASTVLLRSKLFKAQAGMKLTIKEPSYPSTMNLHVYSSDTPTGTSWVKTVNLRNDKQEYAFTEDDSEYYFSLVLGDTSTGTELDYGDRIRVGYKTIPIKPPITGYGFLNRVTCGDNIFPQEFCGKTYNANIINGWVQAGPAKTGQGVIVRDVVSGYFPMEAGVYRLAYNGSADIAFFDADFEFIGHTSSIIAKPTDTRENAIGGYINAPEGTKWARLGYRDGTDMMIVKTFAPWQGGYRPFEEIYPVPTDYDTIKPNEAFANEIEQTVNEVMSGDMGKARFIHVTDTHHGSGDMSVNHTMLYQSMVEVAKRLSCDFILHTGDVITGGSGTPKEVWQENLAQFADLFKDCGVPVIVSRGNHDDNTVGSKSDATIIYNDWWNNHLCKAINQQAKDFVFPDNSNGYYYLDIEGKKLRIVNINSEDLTDAERLETGGQNFAKISQNQLDWLDTDALVVPDGWKIILCSHISCDSGRPNMGISNATALYNVIKTHKGAVIAYMYGHTHMSANYINEELSVQFMSVAASGGGINQTAINHTGHNKSSPSKTLQNEAPTRNMLFDVCIVGDDDRIKRYRFGINDDVLESGYDNDFGYLN